MCKHLLCLVGLLISALTHAAIFTWENEYGETVYSDRSEPGAEEIQVDSLPNYQLPSQPTVFPKLDLGSDPADVEGPAYQSLEIAHPADDEAVRSNNGDLVVSISLSPGLDTKLGHKLVLLLDGKQAAEPGTSSQIQLTNLDRGTHSLQAKVLGPQGAEVKASESTKFHLQRRSTVLQPGSGSPTTPTSATPTPATPPAGTAAPTAPGAGATP